MDGIGATKVWGRPWGPTQDRVRLYDVGWFPAVTSTTSWRIEHGAHLALGGHVVESVAVCSEPWAAGSPPVARWPAEPSLNAAAGLAEAEAVQAGGQRDLVFHRAAGRRRE